MKFVCLGDSFTAGYGVAKDKNWVSLLNEESKDTFINKGVNGDTTGGMLARFYRDVVDEKPNAVFIIGGLNDVFSCGDTTNLKSNIMAMVHQAFHNNIKPFISIPMATIPEMIPSTWKNFINLKNIGQIHKELNDWYKDFSVAFSSGYIDIYNEFKNKTSANESAEALFLDGLHLNESGNVHIKDIIMKTLY